MLRKIFLGSSVYFDNKKAVVGAPSTSIFDLTLSPNIRIGNLTIIPELRLDAGKNEIFEKSDDSPTKSTVTGILCATYHFKMMPFTVKQQIISIFILLLPADFF